MVHGGFDIQIREMNYIVGNFVFIPSSAANRKTIEDKPEQWEHH